MKKQLQGKITSLKMKNTAVVEVRISKEHSIYKKRFNFDKKYKAHLEGGDFQEGDKVIIEETRPISKEKHWKIISKLS